jgi:hypothetical protein
MERGASSSREHGERMAKIETTLDAVKYDMSEQKRDIKELRADMRAFIESADGRYANKLVERGFYALVALLLALLLTAIVKGVIV